MDDSYSFGAWVGRRRRALRLTQYDVAGLVACSLVLIRKIEADERRPSHQIATRLAQALQIPVDQQAVFVRVARAELASDHLPAPERGGQWIANGSVQSQHVTIPAQSVSNLPSQVSSFHGRTREIDDLRALLQQPGVRLVTLTGAGGSGKTRLALQVVAGVKLSYPDGIWFVDLSPVSDTDQIAPAIAQSLRIPELLNGPIRAGVLNWLRERHILLILDNCEHVIDGAADLGAEALRSAAKLTILATSRIPLRIMAEHEFAVAPLGLPNLGAHPPLDHLSQYDAVALFIARARAVRTDFAITATNAPAIAEICTQVDGLPLAIELAAARIRLFSPDQLLSRLIAARMQTLTGGARDLPARQQTIRATIDWSYGLLSPAQQRLLDRLGVFVGGWTLAAAEAVCGDPANDIVEALGSLVEQSMVHRQEITGKPRYTMLETIREYALEQLHERGETAQIQQRHADYFTNLAEEAEPQLRSANQQEWLIRIDAEYENTRAVLDSTLIQCHGSAAQRIIGVRLASALWYYWQLRSRLGEGISWLSSIDASDTAIPLHLRMHMLLRAAWLQRLSYASNSARAEQDAQHGLQIARDLQYNESILMAAIVLVQNDHVSDRYAALGEEGLALVSSSTSTWWRAQALIAFALLEFQRHPDAAQPTCEVGLAFARESGDAWLLVWAITTRACMLAHSDNRTRLLLEEAIARARPISDWLGLSRALAHLAMVVLLRGDFTAAQAVFEERLQAERLIGNLPGIVSTLVNLGELAHQVGDLLSAERLMEEATDLLPLGSEQRSVAGTSLLVRILLDRGEYARARSYAQQALTVARSFDDAHAIGHFLWLSGYAATISGDRQGADQCASELLSLADQTRMTYLRGLALEIMGMIALQRHDTTHARQMLEECRALRQTLGEAQSLNVIWATLQLSCTELASENYEKARDLIQQCLHFHRQTPFAVDLPLILETSAALCVQQNLNIAAHLWATAEALREQIGAPMWPVDRPEYERRVAAAKAQVEPEKWMASWMAGRSLTWEQAADEALAWLQVTQEPGS